MLGMSDRRRLFLHLLEKPRTVGVSEFFPPLGPDQLGDRPHKSRDYIYARSPQDLDQKNGSVNLVQSENDMMFKNIKKHIRER